MVDAVDVKRHDLASLHEGQVASISFSITAEDMAMFAAVSGDHNPLHCDAAFARSRGFADRVVYGALLVAKVSRLIGMELPGRDSLWHGIDLHFVSPLFIGEAAMVEASVVQISPATRSVELRLRIRSGERLIARGRASVSVRDGS